jgi:heme O synthase-like polyprenyltransferase
MASQHTAGALNLTAERVSPRIWRGLLHVLGEYWALTKPEVNFRILVTTFAGFYLASKPGSGTIFGDHHFSRRIASTVIVLCPFQFRR